MAATLRVCAGRVLPPNTCRDCHPCQLNSWLSHMGTKGHRARMVKSGGASLEVFNAPQVKDAPVTAFDEHGLGQEANNLAAINSLKGYRSLRCGRNVELIITDERSYRSEDPGTKFADADFFNKDYS